MKNSEQNGSQNQTSLDNKKRHKLLVDKIKIATENFNYCMHTMSYLNKVDKKLKKQDLELSTQ